MRSTADTGAPPLLGAQADPIRGERICVSTSKPPNCSLPRNTNAAEPSSWSWTKPTSWAPTSSKSSGC